MLQESFGDKANDKSAGICSLHCQQWYGFVAYYIMCYAITDEKESLRDTLFLTQKS